MSLNFPELLLKIDSWRRGWPVSLSTGSGDLGLCFGLALGCVFTPVVVVAGGALSPGTLVPVPQLV